MWQLQWKSSKYYTFWVCVCRLRYPAWNAHAPYCHLWPVRLCNIYPHYLINGTIYQKQKLLTTHNMCVLFSSTILSETFPIVRRTERDMIKNILWSSCKVSVILVILNRNLYFLNRFSENNEISNFMKIRAVAAELFHADRRTDIAKAPKNKIKFHQENQGKRLPGRPNHRQNTTWISEKKIWDRGLNWNNQRISRCLM